MNEILLNAILNLFAIQAALHGASDPSVARALLERYLRQHLRLSQPQVYLDLFEAALDLHQDSQDPELLESVARVAARLRTALPRFEQYVLLLRFVELALQAGGGQAPGLVAGVVARHLDIAPQVVDQAVGLCRSEASAAGLGGDFLVVAPAPPAGLGPCRLLARPAWQGACVVLHLAEAGGYFLKPLAGANLTCDGVPLDDGTFHVLAPGAVIRDQRGMPVYHSEVAGAFLGDQEQAEHLVFQGQRVRFQYPGSDSGLHDFSFRETGGRLIGVMGGSGAGKSTLLGILNGQRRPDSGQVLVNGIDLHRDPQRLEGVIGYVPQDDLLFEDLTVFDNLYLSACLCLANLSPEQRAARVEEVLRELKQPEIRDLKVGTPLDKTISGGQRKRLNIALELIREPSILFVDEPTSGLSSTDSENVMGLLKAQAAQGRLVIAVIHQPSSRIYKMFDRLWVLDQGGRPIYDGNPLDALVYFRRATHKAGQEEYACPHCGNVHPEQLFEIIEEREVDQQGFPGPERKVPAQEWHRRYLAQRDQDQELQSCAQAGQAERRLWRPGVWGQVGVFFLRNLKSRLANRLYLAINLIEPPLLALLAALLCRGAWGGEYAFGDNPNLGIYFFISVVVALFMGLSVSAEEINRDRKILVRERFLNLSWPAYIAAKALYLALVSALQMAVYTLLANTILQVPDMYLVTWLVLLACSLASCLLGLNISAALKSAVTIYILIPLLLVPQIMLGGAVVPFDQLVRRDADDRNTPWVADLMPSRWGYEALVVTQFTTNRFHARFFADDCAVRQSDYLRDRHLEELRGLADYPFLEDEAPDHQAKTAQSLRVLANELPRLAALCGLTPPLEAASLTPQAYGRPQQESVKDFLDQAEQVVRQRRQAAAERLRANEDSLSDELGSEGLAHLKRTYHSGELAKLALNLQTLEDLRLGQGRVVQLALPACQEPESTWGQAQFLAATKKVGAWPFSALAFNLGVLGLMTLLLYAALYVAALSRAMEAAGAALGRLAGLARPGRR
ncbi:MAG: ATP-binding cassette domain-containing protein [Desulfarculus sp.]|nr:ATP-binding cassette domain-containing protein [Desulfarculus sp.]